MKGRAPRLRALAARIHRQRPVTDHTTSQQFNEPPIFPTCRLLPPPAELAAPADAQPVPGGGYIAADIRANELGPFPEALTKPAMTASATPTANNPLWRPRPRRLGPPPNGCPCTAIYSECRCPVLP